MESINLTDQASITPADSRKETDEHFMALALEQAHRAASLGEVPVGAVVVHQGRVIGTGHNAPIAGHDPTAHAEIMALRAAAQNLGNYRLDGCELYVTLEPCLMCSGAMLHARLKRVVFGAAEPKTGAAGSVLDVFANRQLNHQTEVRSGVMAQAATDMLQDFFAQKRQTARQSASPLREDALRAPETAFEVAWNRWDNLRLFSQYENDLPPLQGLRMHVIDCGPATHVTWLCLHSPDAWWPQWADWLMQRAEEGDRVLLPDLIGFGQSDKPKKANWHSLEQHAQVLLALLDSRHVSRARLAVAPGQEDLARVVERGAPDRIESCLPVTDGSLFQLPVDWQSVPFPDAGHRSALRAWRSAGWR